MEENRPRPAAPQGSAPLSASGAPVVVVVAGPTGCGKSALALRVAEAFHGVVINSDSQQLYRELRVLTARPGESDLARAPHRLYGVLSALEPCSAGRFRALAEAEMHAARAHGRMPIVVGGTGMYLKALTEGLARVPEIPEAIRAEARDRMAGLGPEEFCAELARLDPVMAARLAPGDRQRLMRAYEVVRATGRSLAAYQEEERATRTPARGGTLEGTSGGEQRPGGTRFVTIVLDPPRAELYAACERRFDAMMAAGALDEARHIAELGLPETCPVMKAVGVRELLAHLMGELTLEQAVAKAKQATRNYAKRQATWFRHQARGAMVFHEQFSESLEAKIFSFIRKVLLTPGGSLSSLR